MTTASALSTRVIQMRAPGGPEVLSLTFVYPPEPKAGSVRIRVEATGKLRLLT